MAERIKTKYGDAVLCKEGYFKISNKNNTKYGGKLLHRLIYVEEYGEIDENTCIHHIDGNKQNNNLSNLVAMSLNEHASMHKLGENNPNYGGMSEQNKLALSSCKNTTGIFRVCIKPKKDSLQGFTYLYQYYDENGKRRGLSSVNIKTLEEKVKEKGLDWIILDEEKALEILEM